MAIKHFKWRDARWESGGDGQIEKVCGGEGSFSPISQGKLSSDKHGEYPALESAHHTLDPPVLPVFVWRSDVALNTQTFELRCKAMTTASQLATPITTETLNFEAKLTLPFRLHQAPRVKGLILRGQKLEIEARGAIVEKNDEVSFAVRCLDGEWPAHITVNEFKESRGARTR